jgi:aminoglycoside 6'-N-acetyltransferase I
MTIREATSADRDEWLKLRFALWPKESGLDTGMDEILGDPEQICYLAIDEAHPIGFIEMSLRRYAEGCESSPVAFVEGWYVSEERREHGVGAALLAAGEEWGRAKGCTELGSDTEVWRTLSREVHKKLGFEEVGEIVAFRKSL